MATLEKDKNSRLTLEIEQLRSELKKTKVELTELNNYKAKEEERRAQEKEDFLKLKEFFELLGSRATIMFEYGFNGAVQQFKEASYSLEGASSNFLNLSKDLDSLPEENFGSR